MKNHELQKSSGGLQQVVPQHASTSTKPREITLIKLRERILAGHRQTTVLAVASAASALSTGDALLQAKKALGHGGFLQWIDEQITPVSGLSRRTVQRYMRLAKNRETIIGTIRRLQADNNGVALSEEDANRLLAAMKMNDALTLLNLQGSSGKQIGNETQTARRSLTPLHVVDAVAEFLTNIDLDPCADKDEPNHVSAKHFFTSNDSGLCPENRWMGRVFIHPPQDATLSEWVDRGLREYSTRSIDEAVLLLPALTVAPWMPLLDAYPRVYFWDPLECVGLSGNGESQAFAAAVFMLASPERTAEFGSAFRQFGKLLVPHTAEK